MYATNDWSRCLQLCGINPIVLLWDGCSAVYLIPHFNLHVVECSTIILPVDLICIEPGV